MEKLGIVLSDAEKAVNLTLIQLYYAIYNSLINKLINNGIKMNGKAGNCFF